MMNEEMLAKTLVDEKLSKKRIRKCSEGHCYETIRPSKE